MKLQTRWTLIAVGALALDRLLKRVALSDTHFSLLGDALRFELFRNDGIAFSLPLSGPVVWILSVGILIAIGRLAYQDFKTRHYKRAEAYLFFVFGACSNLFDRIAYGYTVDYLIFFRLSAVNIADGMILAGALWLVIAAPKR